MRAAPLLADTGEDSFQQSALSDQLKPMKDFGELKVWQKAHHLKLIAES